MHTIRTINAFICINNHVNSCINSMLSDMCERLGVVKVCKEEMREGGEC